MSRSKKKLPYNYRMFYRDMYGETPDEVPEHQVYSRRDRRISASKRETDVYESKDDSQKRKIRRNDNWKRDVQSDY